MCRIARRDMNDLLGGALLPRRGRRRQIVLYQQLILSRVADFNGPDVDAETLMRVHERHAFRIRVLGHCSLTTVPHFELDYSVSSLLIF